MFTVILLTSYSLPGSPAVLLFCCSPCAEDIRWVVSPLMWPKTHSVHSAKRICPYAALTTSECDQDSVHPQCVLSTFTPMTRVTPKTRFNARCVQGYSLYLTAAAWGLSSWATADANWIEESFLKGPECLVASSGQAAYYNQLNSLPFQVCRRTISCHGSRKM